MPHTERPDCPLCQLTHEAVQVLERLPTSPDKDLRDLLMEAAAGYLRCKERHDLEAAALFAGVSDAARAELTRREATRGSRN